jgi:hypothetical protein
MDEITVMYPCGCEVDFDELSDVTKECPLCNNYLFETESDYDERMDERRQMGLSNV